MSTATLIIVVAALYVAVRAFLHPPKDERPVQLHKFDFKTAKSMEMKRLRTSH